MRAFEVHLNGKKLCLAGIGDVSWVRQRRLHVGDKITVRIVEKKAVDEPSIKYCFDPAKELKNQKIYARKMAKKLGWTIQPRPKSKKTN